MLTPTELEEDIASVCRCVSSGRVRFAVSLTCGVWLPAVFPFVFSPPLVSPVPYWRVCLSACGLNKVPGEPGEPVMIQQQLEESRGKSVRLELRLNSRANGQSHPAQKGNRWGGIASTMHEGLGPWRGGG